jgi:hypothetical protein
MAIKIKIKISPGKEIEKILLKAKKTIDGNIIVSDHPELDIFVMAKKSKIIMMPKEEMDDEIYDTQRRLVKYLTRRGVIDMNTIQAGNLFMSMEATIPEASEGDKIQYLLYVLADFIEEELPFYKDQKEYEQKMEKALLEPEPDEFTEFDPARHAEEKGTLRPAQRQYGIGAIYRL